MDLAIFFEAIGNLLFAALLFFTIAMAAVLLIITHVAKQFSVKMVGVRLSNSKAARHIKTYNKLFFRKLTSDAAKIRADYSHQ
jgi:hypothetical protein